MDQYQLVFTGTIAAGRKLPEVKRNLARLFKINDTKVEQMFNSLPVVVKRQVDYDRALKYQQALRKAGAICQVEEVTHFTELAAMEKKTPPPMTYNPASTFIEDEEIQRVKTGTYDISPKKEGIKGLGDILSGVVLIGIGLFFGGSIFMGDPTWLDYVFDGLGLFWICKGFYKMFR